MDEPTRGNSFSILSKIACGLGNKFEDGLKSIDDSLEKETHGERRFS